MADPRENVQQAPQQQQPQSQEATATPLTIPIYVMANPNPIPPAPGLNLLPPPSQIPMQMMATASINIPVNAHYFYSAAVPAAAPQLATGDQWALATAFSIQPVQLVWTPHLPNQAEASGGVRRDQDNPSAHRRSSAGQRYINVHRRDNIGLGNNARDGARRGNIINDRRGMRRIRNEIRGEVERGQGHREQHMESVRQDEELEMTVSESGRYMAPRVGFFDEDATRRVEEWMDMVYPAYGYRPQSQMPVLPTYSTNSGYLNVFSTNDGPTSSAAMATCQNVGRIKTEGRQEINLRQRAVNPPHNQASAKQRAQGCSFPSEENLVIVGARSTVMRDGLTPDVFIEDLWDFNYEELADTPETSDNEEENPEDVRYVMCEYTVIDSLPVVYSIYVMSWRQLFTHLALLRPSALSRTNLRRARELINGTGEVMCEVCGGIQPPSTSQAGRTRGNEHEQRQQRENQRIRRISTLVADAVLLNEYSQTISFGNTPSGARRGQGNGVRTLVFAPLRLQRQINRYARERRVNFQF